MNNKQTNGFCSLISVTNFMILNIMKCCQSRYQRVSVHATWLEKWKHGHIVIQWSENWQTATIANGRGHGIKRFRPTSEQYTTMSGEIESNYKTPESTQSLHQNSDSLPSEYSTAMSISTPDDGSRTTKRRWKLHSYCNCQYSCHETSILAPKLVVCPGFCES
jgi:hypothetical protein